MKKLARTLLIFSLISLSFLAEPYAEVTKGEEKAPKSKTLTEAEIKTLKSRVEEIQEMDPSEMSWKEKREVKKELKEIKKTLELDKKISISVGALIIIILLIIILF